MADKIVTKVRPRRSLLSLPEMVLLKRVAAYARVSTGSDEQLNSIAAQKDYFEKLINKRPDWIFVGIYADEGISGISTKKREAFNRMVNDAMDGKIDLIVTKSLSRFTRNTVDSLNVIRQLKSVNVGVYFEKEDINTLDSKGEFLITLMSSLAEEESRSISENITWGQRKRFADGRYSMPYKQFLGYKKGADGCPEIVEEEAETVKLIYRLCIEGYSASCIAKMLTSANIPSPAGMNTWPKRTIDSILRNEKYKGAALLQKSFTVDFLQKKTKVNEGEVPQYYVENSHPAIIETEEWERVQLELARRKSSGNRTICGSPFSGKIICGDCGEIYGSKVWHSNSQYRRTIWQCNGKFKGEKKCTTPHLYEDDIKDKFIESLSELLTDREALLADGRLILSELSDNAAIDAECDELYEEMDILSGHISKCVTENAIKVTNQEEYISRYNSLVERYEKLQSRCDALQKKKERRLIQADKLSEFLFTVRELDLLKIEFNEVLWNTTVEMVTVYGNGRMVWRFRSGKEIEMIM